MAKITARTDDGGLHDRVERTARDLREMMREAMSDVAGDAELIFAAYALKGETGKLSRGISTVTVGDTLIIRADAESKKGYDYVGVTRFGHRVKWIYPIHPRKALRFKVGGEVLYRGRVRGFKPKSDWAADALPDVQEVANERVVKLGRGITVRLGI